MKSCVTYTHYKRELKRHKQAVSRMSLCSETNAHCSVISKPPTMSGVKEFATRLHSARVV